MTKSERFEQFIKARFQFSDWNNYISKDKTKLLRQKIIKECEFPRSTIYQNAAVKQRLYDVEVELQNLGVIRRDDILPDNLLDESAVVVAAAELNSRLDNLQERMAVLLASIEEARRTGRKSDGS